MPVTLIVDIYSTNVGMKNQKSKTKLSKKPFFGAENKIEKVWIMKKLS